MFDLDIDKLKAILIEQHENDEKQLEVIFSEAPRVIRVLLWKHPLDTAKRQL